jgi:hypothetical protein
MSNVVRSEPLEPGGIAHPTGSSSTPAAIAVRTVRSRRALEHIHARLTYLVDRGQKPVVYVAPPGGEHRRTADYADFPVRIHNARPVTKAFSLERQGFELRPHESAVVDFYDEDEVRSIYYPEMERLVKAATGASKVLVFDHTTRRDPGRGKEDRGAGRALRQPVRRVHNDYTARSGPQRVRDLLEPEEAERLLECRFAVVNVWRPIHGPVEAAPLAVADAQSIAPEDLVATDLVYSDRIGEIYEVAHSPEQR